MIQAAPPEHKCWRKNNELTHQIIVDQVSRLSGPEYPVARQTASFVYKSAPVTAALVLGQTIHQFNLLLELGWPPLII